MNLIGLMVIYLIVLLIGLFLFSIPIYLSYLFYNKIKTKGKFYKNIGLLVIAISSAFIGYIIFLNILNKGGFGPNYDSAIIRQKIGGTLFCQSEYNADHHSWQYNVNYKYFNGYQDTIYIGEGTYKGREWNKDEQLYNFGNWLILKTGDWSGSDRIIFKNFKNDSTYIYNFNEEFIESDSLWKTKKIKSLANYCCSKAYVDKITRKSIIIRYKFRSLPHEYDNRKITFHIDSISGKIKMINIE